MVLRFSMLYGTAWKKDRTAELVLQALRAGFRAVDVAAQPKHYREDLVGDAIRTFLLETQAKREDLYVQTKFTSINGQDPNNLPYDPRSEITEQVKTSIASSLQNLRPSTEETSIQEAYIDCLVLHSPFPTFSQTLQAWRTLESYVPHQIRSLGISNTSLPILEQLYEEAAIKPVVVQNRFYGNTKFDVELRKFCREKSIIYQSFWTLTGNPRLLSSQCIKELASKATISKESAMYYLVLKLGNTAVLNGTTNKDRMEADLRDLEKAQHWAEATETQADVQSSTRQFQELIGEGHI